jgi:hypothetical protein
VRLLLVHGIGQAGKNPSDLESAWINALQKGYEAAGIAYPNSLQVDFPYYGDALDARVARSKLPMPKDLTPKGDATASPYEDFVRNSLKELQPKAAISDGEVATEAGPIPVTEKGIQNWRLTQALARLIDRRLSGFESFTIDRFLRDVYLYVTDRNTAREINAIVDALLTEEPTVVVGHSLGTVVAYRVLLEQKAKVNLRRFITVGSPLGIKTISSQLGVLNYPLADLPWYNAYDERDIVALNPLRDPFFKTTPAIVNYNQVRNQTDNRHGIIGYINDATVAQSIAEALSGIEPK